MREVTIPNDYNPFVVKVNNVEYFYKAGETVEVPDEVAEVIDRFNGAKVPEPEKLEYVEGFSYDPVADAGKVLQIRDDGRGIEWGESSGGGGGESGAFEEQYGVAGWYSVELTFQLPEMSEDSLEGASVGVVISIITTEGEDLLYISNAWTMQVMLISDNKYTLHVPYHTGDDIISIFNISEIHSGDNVYISADDGFTCSGGVEWNSEDYRFEVTGDGSAIIPLQTA